MCLGTIAIGLLAALLVVGLLAVLVLLIAAASKGPPAPERPANLLKTSFDDVIEALQQESEEYLRSVQETFSDKE